MERDNLQRCFDAFVHNGFKNHTFEVLQPCRVDNGSILPVSVLENISGKSSSDGVVGFVPAAGACTRYIAPLESLIEEYAENDAELDEELDGRRWLLPKKSPEISTGEWMKGLLRTPKALYPCVVEGLTFLEIKCLEYRAWGFQDAVMVCPENQQMSFSQQTNSYPLNLHLFEQGFALKTPRIGEDGKIPYPPYQSDDLAPAGHGALISLFGDIKKRLPSHHSLFITNIDNVVGISDESTHLTKQFLSFYNHLRNYLEEIRQALKIKDLVRVEILAEEALKLAPANKNYHGSEDVLQEAQRINLGATLRFLIGTLGCPLSLLMEGLTTSKLTKLFQRPFVLMGQVPRLASDVGGTPITTKMGAHIFSLCVESPHLSVEVAQRLFANDVNLPTTASHFNPVVVACELKPQEEYVERDHPFWIFSKKRWKGQNVYYRESILYEILGNSLGTNLVWIEIPRRLFNPHKTLEDSKNNTTLQWGVSHVSF